MRIIKFRSFDKQHKCMIYNPELDYVNGTWRNKYGHQSDLMQFTGLLDKNGKEIYEGDIVRFQHHRPAVCVWSGWGWGWKVNTPKGERVYESGVSQFRQNEFEENYLLNNAEILGNIYENPELLK